jgi:unsaturated rhamnogalacturonyl hydrolase
MPRLYGRVLGGSEVTQSDTTATVARVIKYTITHPSERQTWERAPAILGVLSWNDQNGHATVKRWLDRAVQTQNAEGSLNYSDREEYAGGHVKQLTPTPALAAALGNPLLVLYEKTKEKKYLEAAKRQVEGVVKSPRTTDGGIWIRIEGPELWIDTLYMMCPFMARYAKITGETSYADEAFKQFEVHTNHLVDPHAHLGRHAWCEVPNHYPQSTFWARGNGWLISTAVDLITLFPNHGKADFVRKTAKDVLNAIRARQDRCGYLRHILDDPHAKFEASSTLMYAYSTARAVELGILSKDSLESALGAFNVVEGSVGEDGAVPGVAVPPGGPGVVFGTTHFGQGFFLLAAKALSGELGIK